MAFKSDKGKGRRSPPALFAIKSEEKLPPICLLTARFTSMTADNSTPVQSESDSPTRLKVPKAEQFPKTVIPILKHEARSYFSLLTPLRPMPKDLLLRYPKARLPIASCDRDLDKYVIVNGKLKRREPSILDPPVDETPLAMYETRLKAKPDLTGLKELEMNGMKLRRRLRKLERELLDYKDKNYLDFRVSCSPKFP